MSRSKGKSRKGKRTARLQPKTVVDGGATVRAPVDPDEETTRVVVNPVAAASAEAFVAHHELTPPPAFEDKDDMGDYLGEIFYETQRAGNDIALDMETLQPVASATRMPMVAGVVTAGSQVHDLIAEFEDAPTLPESTPVARSAPAVPPPPPIEAYEEAYEKEPLRAARVSGR
jgi:hypothetical protein